MSKFSDLLYELRKEKNLTQSELAEKLGITNKAVSKWETGEAMPDTAQLLPLAEILGVSVDELLRGERRSLPAEENKPQEELFENEDAVRFSSGRDTVEILSRGIFINGVKAEHRKTTYLGRICGCVCATLMAISVIVFVSLGCLFGTWHPLWCIPASAAFGCGIAGCIFDMCDRVKVEEKRKKGENPYAAGACGIVMCISLVVFLCVSAVLDLWHIMWISPVAGVCACMIIGTVGAIAGGKKNKQ